MRKNAKTTKSPAKRTPAKRGKSSRTKRGDVTTSKPRRRTSKPRASRTAQPVAHVTMDQIQALAHVFAKAFVDELEDRAQVLCDKIVPHETSVVGASASNGIIRRELPV